MSNQLEALRGFIGGSHPTLGLDIDGCIDEAPQLFTVLSQVWPGRVVIVTARDDADEAREYVAQFGIRYDDLYTAATLADKPRIIAEQGIGVFFDDQPECLKGMPPEVATFLIRNDGNYDFDDHRWMLSDRTGKLV